MSGLSLKNCSQCKRLVKSRTQVVKPIITSKNPAVLIVSDYPSVLDDAEGVPMFRGGPETAGFWHHKFIGNLGVEKSHATIYTVQCKPETKPKLDEVKNCSIWINYLLSQFKFRLVILYGELPSRLILDFKKPTINYAGKFFISEKLDGLKCFVTYHPRMLAENRDEYLDRFKRHTKLIKNYLYN